MGRKETELVEEILDIPTPRAYRTRSSLIEFIEFYNFIENIRNKEREAMIEALKETAKDREELKNLLKDYLSTILSITKNMISVIAPVPLSNQNQNMEVDIK